MIDFTTGAVGLTLLINIIKTLLLPLLAFLAFIVLLFINKKLKNLKFYLHYIANNMNEN
ncbi:MAG: hypothetical protein PHW32_00845 [Bacilli bacterium]|nr:hypothetical protein [Bacilli bacterium]MDD4283006.1 hypothetical protein [Bacilli bacterium]MDD4718931.1 hypothetical protein [Bacilli bacterium]